jgi:hypothetical protein
MKKSMQDLKKKPNLSELLDDDMLYDEEDDDGDRDGNRERKQQQQGRDDSKQYEPTVYDEFFGTPKVSMLIVFHGICLLLY